VKCSRREHRAADEELSQPHAAGMRHLATRHITIATIYSLKQQQQQQQQ